jgi:hypothetical protein
VLCQVYNINKPSHKPTAKPHEFHPFAKRHRQKPREATPDELKKLFGPNWNKG